MTTTIEWTHGPGRKGESWNPIAAFSRETGKRGWFCTKPSPGCAHCYAEARNRHIGNGLRYAVGNIDKVRFELVNLDRPLHWRKPRMVFVCSMTDLFLEQHTDEMILAVFGMMCGTPRHIYQVLTKRPARMRTFLDCYTAAGAPLYGADMRHIWFGATTENGAAADERIPELLALRNIVPDSILWLSCEPLLGEVSLWKYSIIDIDWVVVGLESGSLAREGLLSHVETIVADCGLSGTPCFVKQLGRHPFDDRPQIGTNAPLILRDLKGGDPSEWPDLLRVREWPEARAS